MKKSWIGMAWWTIALFALAPVAALCDPFAHIGVYSRDAWDRTLTECDRQAAHPNDPEAVTAGVERAEMDLDAAINACREAVEADPRNPRLNYQLARAYGYSGRHEEGRPYREAALNAGYPQSLFVVGYIRLTGWDGGEKDPCYGGELIRRSADAGRIAGLVGFPHYALTGAFESCGAYPRVEWQALRSYLAQAEGRASDYYQTLLVGHLIDRLEGTPPEIGVRSPSPVDLLEGQFSNADQTAELPADVARVPTRRAAWVDLQAAEFRRLRETGLDGEVMYLQWRDAEGVISRQRLWVFEEAGTGTFQMTLYAFRDPDQWADLHQDAARQRALSADDLVAYPEGCRLTFQAIPGPGWAGALDPRTCQVVTQQSQRAMSLQAWVVVTPGTVWYRESGSLASGETVFRVPGVGQYEFRRELR